MNATRPTSDEAEAARIEAVERFIAKAKRLKAERQGVKDEAATRPRIGSYTPVRHGLRCCEPRNVERNLLTE